jgi:hypothetical protein
LDRHWEQSRAWVSIRADRFRYADLNGLQQTHSRVAEPTVELI